MNPARVLYLATSGQVGGAERCLLSITSGLDRAAFDPMVLMGSPGPLEALLHAQATAAMVEPLPPPLRALSRYHARTGASARRALAGAALLPGYLARLGRAGARAQPALVHSNGLKMHYLSALLRPRWNVPLVWHLHDFPRSGAHWSDRALRLLSRAPAAAIANSEAVARAHAARFPALAPKISVIPNGVSIAALQRGDRAAFRARWGLAPDAFVAGMVAIFAPWKGQEVFLRAAQKLLLVAPRAKFLLAGDDIYDTAGHGGQRQALESLARDLGIRDSVLFTGFLAGEDEIASAYAALDVMVHASTQPEPFGRTAIEAMAAGVPVVAAAGGGMSDVIEDGISGFLTPPGDADALARALADLHTRPELRAALSEQGLARVRQRFTEEMVARQIETLYSQLLNHAPHPHPASR